MNTREEIEEFLELKTIAVAGVSRDPNAFSARVFEELTRKGYRLFAVNPKARTIGIAECFPTLSLLPEAVDGVLLFTPPAETSAVVEEAAALGIRHIWIQQGAESDRAISTCQTHHLRTVTQHCIMMFAQPVGALHRVHRWFRMLYRPVPSHRPPR